jgi:hypothetical protein
MFDWLMKGFIGTAVLFALACGGGGGDEGGSDGDGSDCTIVLSGAEAATFPCELPFLEVQGSNGWTFTFKGTSFVAGNGGDSGAGEIYMEGALAPNTPYTQLSTNLAACSLRAMRHDGTGDATAIWSMLNETSGATYTVQFTSLGHPDSYGHAFDAHGTLTATLPANVGTDATGQVTMVVSF